MSFSTASCGPDFGLTFTWPRKFKRAMTFSPSPKVYCRQTVPKLFYIFNLFGIHKKETC